MAETIFIREAEVILERDRRHDAWKALGDRSTARTPARTGYDVQLTPIEEREFSEARFKSRLPITITASQDGRRGAVAFGDDLVEMAEAEFLLFVCMATGAFTLKGGWVPDSTARPGLSLSAELGPIDPYKAISRLRKLTEGHLGDLDPTDFVQVRKRSWRLSTHWRYIRVEVEKVQRLDDKRLGPLLTEIRFYAEFAEWLAKID
jgi:hypothetical protein